MKSLSLFNSGPKRPEFKKYVDNTLRIVNFVCFCVEPGVGSFWVPSNRGCSTTLGFYEQQHNSRSHLAYRVRDKHSQSQCTPPPPPPPAPPSLGRILLGISPWPQHSPPPPSPPLPPPCPPHPAASAATYSFSARGRRAPAA